MERNAARRGSVTWSCPITSSKVSGRYRRYRAVVTSEPYGHPWASSSGSGARGPPQRIEDPPRTRQRALILAAFRPWGGSDDTVTRRIGTQSTHPPNPIAIGQGVPGSSRGRSFGDRIRDHSCEGSHPILAPVESGRDENRESVCCVRHRRDGVSGWVPDRSRRIATRSGLPRRVWRRPSLIGDARRTALIGWSAGPLPPPPKPVRIRKGQPNRAE